MRIDKFLSNLKYGSRKDVTKLIKKGECKINGEVVTNPSFKIDEFQDKIHFLGDEVYFKDSVLIKLHKPKGYVCANKDKLHKTVFELIGPPFNRFDLKIAGRLDIDTEGLVLLTNDGHILHNIISPTKSIYKKYYVEVDQTFDFTMLTMPMQIKDGKNELYRPLSAFIEDIDPKSFYLSIKEGKFHQVKRMVEFCGSNVTYLKRVSIGRIQLDDLELGKYEEIDDDKKRLFL